VIEHAHSKQEHKKQGYRFEKDWPLGTLETHVFVEYKAARTVPVNVRMEAEHCVLNLENVRQILSSARMISVMDCGCRGIYGHCDAPLDVCLDVNEAAERHITKFGAREITLDEALHILERTHEAGLVHMALGWGASYEPGAINSVCSCCSCCCGILSGILRYGLAPDLLKSQAISVTEGSSCTDCGVCVDRCQFGAREMVDGSLSFHRDLCFGCGLCVSTCPTLAITLVDKS
jgi:NAD-dependent dihydropyrimidine dehydrogenase PreA subunit